ncbi:unnamed protein product [Lupinus luteus]|uniref:Uncharacterized protein n=1 Tax=Lupinus luteus TaxID=3873 RepID=A0AAV1VXV0_LUPLU
MKCLHIWRGILNCLAMGGCKVSSQNSTPRRCCPPWHHRVCRTSVENHLRMAHHGAPPNAPAGYPKHAVAFFHGVVGSSTESSSMPFFQGRQQVRKLPNPDTWSWTLGWVDQSAIGVHRSARPFCRRCAPGLNWPGRASGAVTLKKLECSKQAYALDTLAWDNTT